MTLLERAKHLFSNPADISYVELPRSKRLKCTYYFDIVMETEEDGRMVVSSCSYEGKPIGVTVPRAWLEGRFDIDFEHERSRCCWDETVPVITKGVAILEAGIDIKKGDLLISGAIGLALPAKSPYIDKTEGTHCWIVGVALEDASVLSLFSAFVFPTYLSKEIFK